MRRDIPIGILNLVNSDSAHLTTSGETLLPMRAPKYQRRGDNQEKKYLNGEGMVGQATKAQLRMLKTGSKASAAGAQPPERSTNSRFQHTERMKGTLNGVGLTAPRIVPQVLVKMAKTIQASLSRSRVSPRP